MSALFSTLERYEELIQYKNAKKEALKSLDCLFDTASENIQIELLETSLMLKSLKIAQIFSKKMGCPIDKDHGLKEVLPLLNCCQNTYYANKIAELKLYNQTITSRFGTINGMTAWSRALHGAVRIDNRCDIKTPRKFIYSVKREGNEAPTAIRTMLSENWTEMFDKLLQKNEQGVYVLREEREHYFSGKTNVVDEDSSSEAFSGPLNEIARSIFPPLPRVYDPDTGEYEGMDTEYKLRLACQLYPDKMREMTRALLFDLDKKGNEVPIRKFPKVFWETSEWENAWIAKIPTLLETGMLTHEEGVQLLAASLNVWEFVITSPDGLDIAVDEEMNHLGEPVAHTAVDSFHRWVEVLKLQGWRDLNFFKNKIDSNLIEDAISEKLSNMYTLVYPETAKLEKSKLDLFRSTMADLEGIILKALCPDNGIEAKKNPHMKI